MKRTLLQPSLVVVLTLVFTGVGWAGEKGEVVALSEQIGTEIDKTERETYGLFPDLEGYETGRLVRLSESVYRLDFTVMVGSKTQEKSRKFSAESFELTKLHVNMVEKYLASERSETLDSKTEAKLLRKLALRYGSRTRYDVASQLLSDLKSNYPEYSETEGIEDLEASAERLWRSPRPLFKPASLIDPSGRRGLLIFAGYYGAWLGVATPIALDADSPETFGAGLLIVPPLSILVAHSLTKDADLSSGRSKMISFGAHMGTWQGLGWSGVGDLDGQAVMGIGELSGLAGIAAVALLTDRVDYTEGQAELAHAGMWWGGWFGFVVGRAVDVHSDVVLVNMLIGSDALAFGALAARNVEISKTRVRFISMCGVLGALAGFGIDLMATADSDEEAFAIVGATSAGGLALGTYLTRNMDEGKFLGALEGSDSELRCAAVEDEDSWSVSTGLSGQRHPFVEGRAIPALCVKVEF